MLSLPPVRTRRHLALSAAALGLTLLAACGGSGEADQQSASSSSVEAAGAPGAQTATVDGTDKLAFVPDEVDARVGTLTLTFTNTGGVPHNLVFDDKALPAIDTVTGGQTRTQKYTFTAPGTYDFVCTFHPGMQGKVVVRAAS